jgi:uncharacterized protein
LNKNRIKIVFKTQENNTGKFMELEIQHNMDKRRFFTFVEGREAYLTYENDGENVLNFNHTYVPFNLRGRSIAAQIVGYALEYAKENNFKVIPSCSYVRVFIGKNKQYSDLVEE